MTKWKKVSQNSYLNMEDIAIFKGNIYKCWIKNNGTANNIAKDEYGRKVLIGYNLTEMLIDFDQYRMTIKRMIICDVVGNTISKISFDENQMSWQNIPPDSVGETVYNLIKKIFLKNLEDKIKTQDEGNGCLNVFIIILLIISFCYWLDAVLNLKRGL